MKGIFLKNIKKSDPWVFLISVLLSLYGILVLYSLCKFWGDFSFFKKQLIFFIIGLIFAILLSFLDFRAVKESSFFVFFLYILSILVLGGLFLFGTRIRGVRAWYVIGNFTFQPVEIVKIVYILLFAKYFSARHVELYHKEHIILSAIYAFLPAGLVFLQPDFGSAAILIMIWLSMMLIAGIKRKHLFIMIGVGLILSFLAWNFILSSEQKERITTFLEPFLNPQGTYLDPSGTGYHILQSLIAVGSGEIFGKGFNAPYTQAKLEFLPEAHTDFIFASLCEMFGLIGVLVLILLFCLLFWRLLKIAFVSKDNFSKLIIGGFMVFVGGGAFVNIAMNLGLLPITGVPLPFLSYGGSSIISLFVGIGIVESIKINNT